MTTALGLTLILALNGQLRAAPPFSEDAAARLAYMKDSVASYNIRRAEAGSQPFRFRADPIFRMDNPVSGTREGAIFLWTDAETGRPEAAIQVFRTSTGFWMHEWTSLAIGPIVAEVGEDPKWRPSKPGLEFKPLSDAPTPAPTPEARLRQLRALAEGFSASDNFRGNGWSQLRLLPKPWLRYGKAGSAVEDGALFAQVLGTDPEVFLVIESRKNPAGGLRWEYALAPMSSFELKVSLKGNEVWTVPWRKSAKDPGDPFFDMQYSREPH
jgi:hypothetical protein